MTVILSFFSNRATDLCARLLVSNDFNMASACRFISSSSFSSPSSAYRAAAIRRRDYKAIIGYEMIHLKKK